MARQKRTSKELDKARERITNLKSIMAALDLGSGLTVTAYQIEIDQLQGQLDHYNQQLSDLDEQLNNLAVSEKAMAALSERMLDGVGVKYGKDSNEYEKAGGVRKSEYKKPERRTPPTSQS
ncbi:MAG: hypothetical protein HY870_22895 [Chloroflexi bacterium]|nr:hypothetical protein [Chloroflexota bacterium]